MAAAPLISVQPSVTKPHHCINVNGDPTRLTNDPVTVQNDEEKELYLQGRDSYNFDKTKKVYTAEVFRPHDASV